MYKTKSKHQKILQNKTQWLPKKVAKKGCQDRVDYCQFQHKRNLISGLPVVLLPQATQT
jgi:hypothetical protein